MEGEEEMSAKVSLPIQGRIQGGSLGAEEPPSPSYIPPFAEEFMSSLSPTFIISVHARFSMSDSFVDLPQEVVN